MSENNAAKRLRASWKQAAFNAFRQAEAAALAAGQSPEAAAEAGWQARETVRLTAENNINEAAPTANEEF